MSALTQRWEALSRADDVRIRRRVFKAQLKAGEVLVVDAVCEPEWWMLSTPVFEFLGWAPKLGPMRVNRVLRRADVWPLKPIGSLTRNQKDRLVGEIALTLPVRVERS